MNKNSLIEYISGEYGEKEEFPFEKYPDISVFRHKDNKKWFAIFLDIPANKLGIKEKRNIWTVGLKCESIFRDSFLKEKGVYLSYHMNKNHWVTVDIEAVDEEFLKTLVDISFQLTKKKYNKKSA